MGPELCKLTSDGHSHKFDNVKHKEKCCSDFVVTSVVTIQKLHDFSSN